MPYGNNDVIDADGALTAAQLDAVEAEIGQKLPAPLRAHYAEFNGGQLRRYRFRADDGELYELHEFLAMKPSGNGAFEETFRQARVDPGYLPAGLVPFAIDPGGALICMGEGTDTDGQVFFFNPEDADDLALALRFLAPTLRDLIEGMS